MQLKPDKRDLLMMGVLLLLLLGLGTLKMAEAFHRVNEVYMTLNQ